MKKLFFTATLFLGLATLGFSQEKPAKKNLNPEEQAKRKTEMLSEKLSLTKEQQDKIYAIHLEQAKKMQKIHAEMQKEKEENRTKIAAVLTAEQKKTFQELREERQHRAKGRMQHRCEGEHPKEEMNK